MFCVFCVRVCCDCGGLVLWLLGVCCWQVRLGGGDGSGASAMGYSALRPQPDSIPTGCASSASRRPQATYTTKSTSMLSGMLRELYGRCDAKVGRHTFYREGCRASNCTRQGLRQTTRAGSKLIPVIPYYPPRITASWRAKSPPHPPYPVAIICLRQTSLR